MSLVVKHSTQAVGTHVPDGELGAAEWNEDHEIIGLDDLHVDNVTLTGAATKALHRSPNAITATYVYDTSKDSDGGAWTEKCQHTSWYNEALSGKWLGRHVSELSARNTDSIISNELLANSTFDTDTTGWVATYGTISSVNGRLRAAGSGSISGRATQLITCTIGKTYRLSYEKYKGLDTSALVAVQISSSSNTGAIYLDSSTVDGEVISYFTATQTQHWIALSGVSNSSSIYAEFDNISIKEVLSTTTQSNDYYQSTTDGKFYRLYRNLLKYSEDFSNAVWNAAGISLNTSPAPDGTNTATLITEDGVSSVHRVYQAVTTTNTAYTLVFYAKYTSRQWITGKISNSATASLYAWFDIQNGIVGTVQAGLTASIEAANNGWFKCTLTVANAFVGTNNIIIAGAIANGDNNIYAGSSVWAIWHPQLEQGSVATTYEPKTADGSIGEVFRGNKREFPKLAGIVADSSSVSKSTVTIYDLTEPSNPMWMRFAILDQNNKATFLGYAINNTVPADVTANFSVAALNSRVYLGCYIASGNGNVNGGRLVDFSSDSLYGTTKKFWKNISRRHDDFRNNGDYSTIAGTVGSSAYHAVAMTILPDAPINYVTGLRVPTIAIAMSTGISLIKHDGNVFNSSINASHEFKSVVLTPTLLVAGRTNDYHYYYYNNPGSISSNFAISSINTITASGLTTGTDKGLVLSNRTEILSRTSAPSTSTIKKLKNFESVPGRSLLSTITPTYNTGHQPGDIRRTYLSSNVVESIGPSVELVTNGTFDVDVSGWTLTGTDASASVTNGVCTLTRGSSTTTLVQSISTVPGRMYQIFITQYLGTETAFMISINGQLYTYTTANDVVRKVIFTATSTSTSVGIQSYGTGTGSTSIFDNISVKEITPDCSYKAQGAQIYGTLTKSPVA